MIHGQFELVHSFVELHRRGFDQFPAIEIINLNQRRPGLLCFVGQISLTLAWVRENAGLSQSSLFNDR